MERAAIAELVKDIVVDVTCCGVEDYREDALLVVDLGADSLDCVEMLMFVEDEFGVTVPDDVEVRWKRPADVVKWLVWRCGNE